MQDGPVRGVAWDRRQRKSRTAHGAFEGTGTSTDCRPVQNFWDPATGEEFHYNREESAWVSRWWHGEPVRVLSISGLGEAARN